jgi:hypothetical protein
MQVPEGAFYCYECTPTSRRPEDDAAEDIGGFKPLFIALDKTNPRAFALPQDVQNYFEDVSARADGSYFEEVKKFPL